MGILNWLRRVKRRHWHICYECLRNQGNVAEEAIFYYDGPPEEQVEGHATTACPRCQSLNTRSFQFLKDEEEDAALFGLERIVRSNPRERFPVKRGC